MSKAIKFPYLFPVGFVYISVINTNPSTWFGGTWQAFGTGRTLVGVDTSQTEFNTVKKTGGEKTHTLTTAEMPRHNHKMLENNCYPLVSSYYSGKQGWRVTSDNAIGDGDIVLGTEVCYTGSSNAHNNLQPYITVYMFVRTA